MQITQELLNELLDYDPETGFLTWKHRSLKYFKTENSYKNWNTKYSNKKAGRIASDGYRVVGLFYKVYKAHRLIWCLVYGHFPDKFIDHINHDKDNNTLGNLRLTTNSGNQRNQKMNKKNTSGFVGVRKKGPKWEAQIKIDDKSIYLGRFFKFEDAVEARKRANKKYGYHPNHGT